MSGTGQDDDRAGARAAQDARLAAWLDGELDKEGADAMSARIADDAALGRRAERLTRIDGLVRAAVPEEPVPDALLQRLGLSDRPAEVVDLAAARRARTVQAGRTASAQRWSGSTLWRIAAQVLVIGGVGLGAALWLVPHGQQAAPDAAYRTLSNTTRTTTAGPAINAVVMFGAGTDPVTARRIVSGAGGSLIGGATAAGAWKVSIAPARRDAVLAELRRDPRVTLAEPVDGAGQ